jgi:low temperature requirement protein LtrA
MLRHRGPAISFLRKPRRPRLAGISAHDNYAATGLEPTIDVFVNLVPPPIAAPPWPGRPRRLGVLAVMRRPITTTEDQSTTFIELFFDLVFVYAVTQTVSLVHEELSWAGVAHAVIVFWLVWWAWTQFTWALNSADTTHPAVEAVMLAATAIAFLMAVTIPDAFGDAGGWFAATYIAVRVVGLALYGRVAWDDVAKRAAVRRFALLSAGGLAAVAGGGVVSGDARAWWWAAAVLLDVVAAVAAGAAEGWDVRPDHFSERHGLFVIIALGESLIVAGAGLTGAERTTQTVAVAILAVAVTCGLWWSYFVTAKPLLDDAIRRRDQAGRTHLARDVYSILHFVVVFGVVLLAVAVEEAVAHPHQALPAGGSLALAGGVVGFVGGAAAALRRSGNALSGRRLVIVGAVAAGVWLTHGVPVTWSLLVVALGLLLLGAAERATPNASRRA